MEKEVKANLFWLLPDLDKGCEMRDFRYGKNTYDYQEGTLIFIAPGQMIGVESSSDELYQPMGHGDVFHPDLIPGTSLGPHIDDYTFFSYHVNEALHVSDRERKIIVDCFSKISYESEHAVDKLPYFLKAFLLCHHPVFL